MGKTLNLMIKNLQSFVDDCYDTIALFLCWHLVMRYQLTCHKRAVPALDKHWETLTAIIWPRYLKPCLHVEVMVIIIQFNKMGIYNFSAHYKH